MVCIGSLLKGYSAVYAEFLTMAHIGMEIRDRLKSSEALRDHY